jgi:phage shock protein A
MSALGDAMKGIRQILLMQDQIQRLEAVAVRQNQSIDQLADDLIAMDRRIIRIETMIEMTTGRPSQPTAQPPRIEG